MTHAFVDPEFKPPVETGDFLADQGYDDPDEMRLKFALASDIMQRIEALELNQTEAANLTGLKQPDISRIVNGVVRDYSVYRLMKALCGLGKDVVLQVIDAPDEAGHVYVAEPVESELSVGPKM